jgi:hypothetical protein
MVRNELNWNKENLNHSKFSLFNYSGGCNIILLGGLSIMDKKEIPIFGFTKNWDELSESLAQSIDSIFIS